MTVETQQTGGQTDRNLDRQKDEEMPWHIMHNLWEDACTLLDLMTHLKVQSLASPAFRAGIQTGEKSLG